MNTSDSRHQPSWAVRDPAPATDAVTLILKLVGEACNLDCTYCYEKRKPYSGGRVLHPSHVASALRLLPHSRLAIELHGGEPLLYPRRNLADLGQLLAAEGTRIARVNMQSNATLLDRSYMSLLAATFPTLQLGISCDGPPGLATQRLDYRGKGTAQRVERALRDLHAAATPVGVICVVTRESVAQASVLMEYFASFAAIRMVKFVPCFDVGVSQGAGPTRREDVAATIAAANRDWLPWSIRPHEFTSFLEDAWRAWIGRTYWDRLAVEPFVSILRKLNGRLTSDCHFEDAKCGHVFTLYPDGSLGACDELERATARYGMVDDSELPRFTGGGCRAIQDELGLQLQGECSACSHASVCGGGCIATRRRLLAVQANAEYCQHRKDIIDFVSTERRRILLNS